MAERPKEKVSFVRIKAPIYEQIRQIAKADDRSVSKTIDRMLRKELDKANKEEGNNG